MNKIAIVSDSHFKSDLLSQALEHLKALGAEAIVHCGDFQTLENLKILHNCGLPYLSVFGNNDHALLEYQQEFKIYKEPHFFKIKEFTCKVMHLPYYLTPDTNFVFFGHTHQFETYKKENTIFINPGEVCARNKPQSEFAMLEINEDSYIINHYYKHPSDDNYEKEEYKYDR